MSKTLDFDPDALREKYRHERDKRLRPDGNDQYVEVEGRLPPLHRRSLRRARLHPRAADRRGRRAGHRRRLRRPDGGGPPARGRRRAHPHRREGRRLRRHLVLEPLSRRPVRHRELHLPAAARRDRLHPQGEVQLRARRSASTRAAIGEHFDLYKDACFQTEIRELRWLEDENRWLITTNRDDAMQARYVVMSNGPLNRPKLPGIPGIETFKGHTFHTSRWDYGYTGGDTDGRPDKLADKRVAIIGTGATAIQCVPHLGRDAKQLYVFQRTPSSVDLRGNKPTDPDWAASLSPAGRSGGWRTSTSWSPAARRTRTWSATAGPTSSATWSRRRGTRRQADALEELRPDDGDRRLQKMNQIRARVDATVKDAATAEALKPWYRQFCKRPTFNDDYLPTFNRPNVTLVDTEGKGVERVDRDRAGGRRRRVRGRLHHLRHRLRGRHRLHAARRLRDRRPRSAHAHRALGRRACAPCTASMSHGFPNCFHMGVTQIDPDAELPAPAGRAGAPHRRRREGRIRAAGADGRTDLEAEAGWVQTIRATATEPRVPTGLHPRLLQW